MQSFKYLGAIISEGRLQARSARQNSLKQQQLCQAWRRSGETETSLLRSKIRLLRSLVISIFLYACESWTLTADLQRRIQAMEMRCYRRLLNISYTEHITNVEVRNRIERAIGPIRRLAYYCQKKKAKMVMAMSQGLLVSQKRSCRVQSKAEGEGVAERKRWEDNINDWTCLRAAESLRVSKDRNGWREVVKKISDGAPTTTRGHGIGTRYEVRIKFKNIF